MACSPGSETRPESSLDTEGSSLRAAADAVLWSLTPRVVVEGFGPKRRLAGVSLWAAGLLGSLILGVLGSLLAAALGIGS